MQIDWIQCATYESAKDHTGIIYLHEWNDKPFYWGKAERSFFGGGHRRNNGGLYASGRYNSGYRHWIEGCLQHGGKLYVGRLDPESLRQINQVENYLICTYGHVMNTRFKCPPAPLHIKHVGSLPACLRPCP